VSATLRERLMPWVMAAVRLAAGWLLSRPLLAALLSDAAPLHAAAGTVGAPLLAALLLLGLAGFAWPRTCLAGAAVLAAGIGATSWLAARAGLGGPPLATALAVIAVLALGEWLTRLLARRPGRE
jgi:hypothetical protein